MAGAVGFGNSAERRRVFVLVDQGITRGVFNSWDEAEVYADQHRLPLDHLMEYETRRDYPDHLHLLVAVWEKDWEFQGPWSKFPPRWDSPPKKIRLDHYHLKGGEFQLFRQREFDYEEGILERINPMAPDNAMLVDLPIRKAATSQWKPRLAPLKPITEEAPKEDPVEKLPEFVPEDIPSSEEAPLNPAEPVGDKPAANQETIEETEEPEAPTPEDPAGLVSDETPLQDAPHPPQSPAEPAPPTVAKPGEPRAHGEGQDDQPGDTQAQSKPGPSFFEEEDTSNYEGLKQQPRISFQKKSNPLKLRTKSDPQPIPTFKPAAAPPVVGPGGQKSSVELAYAQQEELEKEAKRSEDSSGKVRRIWSLPLILSVAMVVICWSAGLFWVLRPEPTASAVVAQMTTLTNARTIIFEPDMTFFQLQVDPVHQERWVQSLSLEPIEMGRTVTIPTYHALDTWVRPEGFVRPPYSLTEVDEWLNLRLRRVQYGFTYTWEDGTILILDLESDMLIGWGYAQRFPELLN